MLGHARKKYPKEENVLRNRPSLLVTWCVDAELSIPSGVNVLHAAALTSCFYFSTEHVLSVQCSVRCLGKDLCDSPEFLDVSNASSTTHTQRQNLFGVS